jgi:hypothetical protein
MGELHNWKWKNAMLSPSNEFYWLIQEQFE